VETPLWFGENRLPRPSLKHTVRYQLSAPFLLILFVAGAFALATWAADFRGVKILVAAPPSKPTLRPDDLREPNHQLLSAVMGNARRNAVARKFAQLEGNALLASFSLQQKITQMVADGFSDDQFGISVAISSDTAVVGAYHASVGPNMDQGAAYVFKRSGSTWSQQQKLTASDGAAGDGFGVSVAVDGDTLIVGAYAADAGTEPEDADRGAAYVFTRSGNTWTEQQRLLPNDGLGGDLFGFAVAVNADTAFVGAPLNDTAALDAGAAYVFTRSNVTWTQEQKLLASDRAEEDSFGAAIAVEADTAVLASLRDDVSTNINQGSAYVFTRTNSTWSQQQQLTASDGTANDQFGVSVGLSGNSIIVGANFKDNGANLAQGAAYIFTGSGASWTQQQKLSADDGAREDAFGTSVAISGTTAVIGSSDNDITTTDQGSAYTFTRSGTTWTQEQNLAAVDGAASDFFGSYVAIDGNTIIAGAPLANVNPDQGAAYIFAPTTATLTINDVVISEGNSGTTTANFTVSLAPTSLETVTVHFATADGTATAGSDYVSATGTLTFTPGQPTQPISITVNGDTLTEPNETFFVNLSNATNALIADSQGRGTIQDNDPGANLPPNFVETQINGLASPTAMTLAPDGRIFVCEQTGNLRVIKNGALLPTPFLTVTVDSSGERGLLGVAFDPNFAANQFIYVYYTANFPTIHNRVSRFIANGDVAVLGSELVILDLNNLSGATNHNGGAIHFGLDGKLYIAVGENANSANSQSFNNLLGKMLRLNPDPADLIPADNPYFNDSNVTGNNKAIWALGLRNPFTFGFQPGTGRLFINDVGQDAWEEINEGVAHSNYGWPTCEGPSCSGSPPTDYRAPIYTYNHSTGTPTGCAIVGGTFYNPATVQFPAQYVGKYFFADLCNGFIRYVDPNAAPPIPTSTGFATGISSPVDVEVANDGSLYYLARGNGSVYRVQFVGGPTAAPASIAGEVVAGDGSPLSGVTIELSGGSNLRTAVTNNEGYYSFAEVETSTFCTVTPLRANYVFEPARRSFNLLATKTDAVFTATAATASANPLDTSEFFVRQQYLDFLGREPDQGGLDYWSSEVRSCNNNSACVNAKRVDVSAAFFIEQEFQHTGSFVYRVYKASLGRCPKYGEFVADQHYAREYKNLDDGQRAFVEAWVARDTFRQMYPDPLTPAEFVNKLYDTAGLRPYSAERQQQIATMIGSGKTRAAVVRDVVDISEFKLREYNPAFVLIEYFGYLQRDPEPGGYQFWLEVLNNREPNNYRAMVCAFITSEEYQQRFSSVVTRNNSSCQVPSATR